MRLAIAHGSLIVAELNAVAEYIIQENILLPISLIGRRLEGVLEELALVVDVDFLIALLVFLFIWINLDIFLIWPFISNILAFLLLIRMACFVAHLTYIAISISFNS